MKLFGTDGIRGKANVYPMTAEVALKVGKAAGIVFGNGKKIKVIIGKDTRLSGYLIEYALAAGLISVGVEVYFVGPMPTPAIAHLTRSFAADAGIVISASHNPFDDNGIKFFGADGFKLPDEVEEKIEKLALSDIDTSRLTGSHIGSAHRIGDARGRYIEFVKNSTNNNSLNGLRIVLDCANGSAYHIAKYIFSELGADVIVVNANPDGKNINLNCGAMHPENLAELVLAHKADAGIALDGDADRVIMVDELGNIIDGDFILAIAVSYFKLKTLVTTKMANLGLIKAMQKLGIKVIQTDVGDRYVIEEMKKNNYLIGGEQSGHIIFMDHTTTGDGTLSALQILNIMKQNNKKLSELALIMKKYPQILLNIVVKEKKDINSLSKLKDEIRIAENKLGSDGRVFVRYSGTQNLLRIMVEGPNDNVIKKLAEDIAAVAK